ncbi:uncharacterized protein LOC116342093 [Contarinia nasturtii]|uniref:uncharacterized protein LOC116342093 n=1 Tax=Contarinia nasturtii TaxID=265458 RepID=UPI0012D4AF8A|nr:uncharacterized protein LOC116342093 [Contarinia nasturtii]
MVSFVRCIVIFAIICLAFYISHAEAGNNNKKKCAAPESSSIPSIVYGMTAPEVPAHLKKLVKEQKKAEAVRKQQIQKEIEAAIAENMALKAALRSLGANV